MKAYVASGWFTPAQEKARLKILAALKRAGIACYSPKDDYLYSPDGGITPDQALAENLLQIRACSFVIASTEGKDMGTLFECGYAHAEGRDLVYFWEGEGPLNLMLSQSAHAVLTSYEGLVNYLKNCKRRNELIYIEYKGEVE